MVIVAICMKILEILAAKALRRLEMSISQYAKCHMCGCSSWEICNFDDLDMPGTVKIDGSGEAIEVEGFLLCVECGEVFDPDASLPDNQYDRPNHLRLVEGGKEC